MKYTTDSLLEALYETLPDPVVVLSLDRTILAANAAAISFFGYPEQDFLKMRPSQLYTDPEEPNRVRKEFFSDNRNERPLHRRVTFLSKDGVAKPAEITLNSLRSNSGEAVGIVTVIRDLSDVVAVEQEKLFAEGLLNEAFESISEGFAVFDDADRLVFFNEAYRSIYNVSAPAIKKGESYEAILRFGLAVGQYPSAGTTQASQEAWLKNALATHERPGDPIIEKVGPDRWIQVEERVTKNNYRVGMRTDVSALRRIKSEAERLGHILEGVSQEVYLICLNSGKIINANRAARDNLQYSLSELREMNARDLNAEHSGIEIANVIAPIVSGEAKVVTADTWHRRKDGTTYPCRVRVEMLDDTTDPVMLAFAEDISERLEIERALERKQQQFETLVRNLPDIITRSSPDTTLTYVNANYADFTGIPVEKMLGRKFLEYTPAEILDELTAHLESLTPENPMRTIEQPIYNKDGERRWYLWSNLMVFDGTKPVELVSVGRDITESREAQERIAIQSRELALRNEALEQFGSIVSHDLKAPLRQIRVFSEMIKEDSAAGKTNNLASYSAHVVERARAMERMISSLFSYSQLAYRSVAWSRFSLRDAVSEAWKNLAMTVEETAADISGDVDLTVSADFNLMIQLLQNLFANSIKYRRKEVAPQIRVSAVLRNEQIEIAVTDNGIGIDPKHADVVFDVFERVHADEHRYDGAGIGLALCRRIAKSHGGSIAIDTSFRPGARFVIRLPARGPAKTV
ncbi:PAS domain-containing sensor histidine kinase [Hoeflea sp.]|uniref:PAS domain-containing sensor histidine kinase n=1 Tax=Hoeflea sp. TaxID=1940281 RepID=UPI003BB01A81